MNFYLLGYPVEHSVSPVMHNAAFKAHGLPHRYMLLETPPDQLAEKVQSLRGINFGGANVTIPHKIEIIKYLDGLAESALKAGAVNTIENRDGALIGHNTDALGGYRALREAYGDTVDARVVLLGAGGAARALAQELAPQVADLIIMNRTVEKAEEIARSLPGNTVAASISMQKIIKSADIIINATPVGMTPDTEKSPIDPEYLHKGQLVFDIVYNPLQTKLQRDAEQAGAATLGGLWMLVYQGVEAYRIWTGLEPDADTMYASAHQVLEATR